jgi:hypothetical protein
MRVATLLFAPCLVGVLALAQLPSSPKESFPSQQQPGVSQRIPDSRGTDGVRMWRRAEIQVVPLDLVAANRLELQSFRDRQERIEADNRQAAVSDPAVRDQIARQLQLLRAVLAYADRQGSDYGKSPAAIDVQRHLNQIEGQVMCEACHASVVAKVRTVPERGGR